MCSFEIVGNETTREESGFDRVSEFFLFATGVAMEDGRAVRPQCSGDRTVALQRVSI